MNFIGRRRKRKSIVHIVIYPGSKRPQRSYIAFKSILGSISQHPKWI
jgi:hypothetical protein